MEILAQFLLRLAFGLAAGMAITSPQLVPSGFFRNHLYVTLGLTTLAAFATSAAAPEALWYAIGAAVASYAGSVCWLYEKKTAGILALFIVAMLALNGTFAVPNALSHDEAERYLSAIPSEATADQFSVEYAAIANRLWGANWLRFLAPLSNVTSGLLLGLTTASMLLGHWYLNSPTMQLAPLRRLLIAMGAALLLQAVVSAVGAASEVRLAPELSTAWLLFLLLRWSFGLVAVAILTWMAWRTLKIPNTQSATGILYVAVIGVFVGELTSLLLSSESAFPL
jgi:hypothetical protein